MARIKGGLNARKKHNRVLKLAKGYRGARSKPYSKTVCHESPGKFLCRKKREKKTVPSSLDCTNQCCSQN